MKFSHDGNGNWTVEQNGIVRSNNYTIGSWPSPSDLRILKSQYEQRGAVIISS